MSSRGLCGKTAIVSGAASGIGAAVTAQLLNEGCKVVGIDVKNADFPDLSDKAWVAIQGDVSLEGTWTEAIDATRSAFGPVQLLVNCAGVLGNRLPIHEMEPSDFDRVIAVNLRGVFLGMRASIREMRASGSGGAIVNVSSVAGLRAKAGSSAYGTSKRGMLNLSQVVACEGGPHGVRVNAVCPGPVRTPFLQNTSRGMDLKDRKFEIPLQRMAEPEEVADLITFLLSDQASFITGGVYSIDGGMSI